MEKLSHSRSSANREDTIIKPKRLNGITLAVRDIERSASWYRGKFGFEKLYDDSPNSDGIIIGADGVELCLQQQEDAECASLVDHQNELCVRLIGFEVTIEDLAKVETEFVEDKDIVVLEGHPKYRSRIVEDPDGHPIELYAMR